MATRRIDDENTKKKVLDLYPNLGLREVSKRVGFSMKSVREFLIGEGVTLRTRGRPRGNKVVAGEVRPVEVDQEQTTTKRSVFDW